jgi:hypothetical protein
MKKSILATVVCVSALMGTASAQTVSAIKVTLPYAASVGSVMLPAGEYTIRDLQDDGAASVLQIVADDGKGVVAMAMEVVAPKQQHASGEARVVMRQTEAGYQIQTIWLAGREIGYEFVRTK